MVQACAACNIHVVRKPNQLADGTTRYVASVWTLSDDRGVRLQQKRELLATNAKRQLLTGIVPDEAEIIPYTFFSNKTKVAVRVPAELRCKLILSFPISYWTCSSPQIGMLKFPVSTLVFESIQDSPPYTCSSADVNLCFRSWALAQRQVSGNREDGLGQLQVSRSRRYSRASIMVSELRKQN